MLFVCSSGNMEDFVVFFGLIFLKDKKVVIWFLFATQLCLHSISLASTLPGPRILDMVWLCGERKIRSLKLGCLQLSIIRFQSISFLLFYASTWTRLLLLHIHVCVLVSRWNWLEVEEIENFLSLLLAQPTQAWRVCNNHFDGRTVRNGEPNWLWRNSISAVYEPDECCGVRLGCAQSAWDF